jgi:hypothetical protein
MALQRFRASPLPIPPAEYSPEHFRQLIRVIELYFSQLDSLAPIVTNGIQLVNLPTSEYGLPSYTVYRIGEDLKIVVPNISRPLGVSASGVLGAVSIILGPPARPLGVSTSGSLGTVSVTIAP